MGIVAGGTVRPERRPGKHHPFGVKVPAQIVWPPYQYVVDPDTKKPVRRPGLPWWQRLIKWFVAFTPAEQGDVSDLAAATMKHFRDLGNIMEEDLRSVYDGGQKYSNLIVQYVQDLGRIIESDLEGHARDIRALKHDLHVAEVHLEGVIRAHDRAIETRIKKAQAYAIHKAVADSRAYVVKTWAKKIDASYHFYENRYNWFHTEVEKWWKVVYHKTIRPIKTQNNNQSIQIGIIWATINVEIRPALKLVAKAGDWLKWFAHWKRDALLAFGTLKAGEVAHWLEEKYVGSVQ